ncbi:MAG: nucleoside triphosphate pyrophosphohydrolase [Anaerolineae bacterium]|nr:nucleoside triphosphate pyrophosphohydrolase [Anaerolineae bacterium]
MNLTIVGLGPGDPKLLTLEAQNVLARASEIYVRTRKHPTVDALPATAVVHSFDRFYEEYDDFAQVYAAIAEEVIRLARREEGVVYAVPGHPLVGERSVQLALRMAREAAIPVRIVDGLSFVEPTLAALGVDALDGLQIADATELALLHHPRLDPDRPALVAQLYSRDLAAEVKLTLMNQYPDEHPVVLVGAAGTPRQRVAELPLYEIDRQAWVDHLTSLYVPPLPQPSGMESFQETIAHLRAPDGCPWDREQTHQTLRTNLLEEAYEALEAIDRDDADALMEELGDLLLQIVLHAQIATDEGEFRMPDVIAHIDAKLKRRHPHVFGDVKVSGAAEVTVNWEEIKREERNHADHRSMLDGVPKTLPALSQAQDYQMRVARVGFDWPGIEGVRRKITEELRELDEARTAEEREGEMGDLLFAVVNLARWLGVDAESALRRANARFARRFAAMERRCAETGRTLADLTLEEQDALWEAAKADETP